LGLGNNGIGRMQAPNVACPSCQGVATLSDAAPLGKNVTCPTCGKLFTVTPDMVRSSLPSSLSASTNTQWWIDGDQQPIEVPAIPVGTPAQSLAAAAVPPQALMGKLVDSGPSRAVTAKSRVAVAPAAVPVAAPHALPSAPTRSNARPLAAVAMLVSGLVVF